MRTYRQPIAAPPSQVWALIARPAAWHRWAPHLRGARGLGAPEVEAGACGTVRLFGAVPVPACITAKQPGRSWTWRVGPVTLRHRVEPVGDGAVAAIDLSAPGSLEAAVGVSYGPLIALLLRNLARVAADES